MRATIVLSFILVAACDPAAAPETSPPAVEKPPSATQAEPAFRIDAERITVSGISSGAYMAGQFHVAHSSLVRGAGLLAGGPYYCAGGEMTKALGACVKGGDVGQEAIAAAVHEFVASDLIDDSVNLRDDRVWIFHGAADETVHRSVSAAAVDFYRNLVPAESIAFVDSVDAIHGMPTQATGRRCHEFASPFINACGYDAAGELLEHLYGALNAAAEAVSELTTVSQAAYGDAQLTEQAWLYAPSSCREGAECGLHIAFHGCGQSGEFVGDAFAKGAGFNEWAETNRLVVLYPQVKSSKLAPVNPLGCWDWWGYTGGEYATKEGPQISAVRSMIDALMQGAP